MPVAIRITGANFTNYVDRAVPYLSRAAGYWLFGTDGATSGKNLAPNGSVLNGTWVGSGTPTFGAGYADLTPEASLNTGISVPVNSPYTFISIVRASSAQVLSGSWHDGINGNMHYRSPTDFCSHATNGGTAFTVATKPAWTGIQFFAATKGASRASYFHDGTVMQSATGGVSGTSVANSYQIGPRGGTGTQTDLTAHRHVANMLFLEALSAAEVAALYTFFKWKVAARGLVLV